MDGLLIEDVYRRKGFADSLVTLIKKVKSPFCFGIDARWGNGKTTFVNEFLKPSAEANKLPIVVFDCFEHERMGDPFFSITQHILAEVTPAKDAVASDWNERIRASVTDVALGTGKVMLKAISKTLLKQELSEVVSELTTPAQGEIIADDVTTKLEEFLASKLQSGLEYRQAKESFQECIEKLASELSDNKKIVVVIDELDRCTPSFALQVLESMKHLLNAAGLVFVLTYHRDLLCGLIRHEFGADIDANMYLHKFVNHDLVLPTSNIEDSGSAFSKLCNHFMNDFNFDIGLKEPFIESMNHLHLVYKFEARTIGRMVMLFALATTYNMSQAQRAVLIVWAVKYPQLLKKFVAGQLFDSKDRLELKYDDIHQFITSDMRRTFNPMITTSLDCMFEGAENVEYRIIQAMRTNVNQLLTL